MALSEGIYNNDTISSLSNQRLTFLDNLRVFLTVLVIAHHAGQAYGPTGGRWLIFNPERADILGAFFPVNAAFFMGLFFLISGYFLPAAYNRKGAKAFLSDRCLRLGIPILLFTLFVFPCVFYLVELQSVSFASFLWQYWRQGPLEFGHLWFLVHLLVYAVGYMVWRTRLSTWLKPQSKQQKVAPPSHSLITLYLIGLAIVTFMIRIWYPVDRWERLLGIIPAEIAHLPQYLSLFIVGIVAYHHDWLRRMPTRWGLLWLGIGISAAVWRYGDVLGGRRVFAQPIFADGGWNWRSLAASFWEATVCVGLCVGLLVWFREYLNTQGKVQRVLAKNAYAVYLIHLLVVVAVQFSIATVDIDPLLKFGIVTFISTPLCFLMSHYLRQFPLASRVRA
ncbi:MAG: acyltransferase [Elainellaceae cyanobacterium]